MDARELAAMKRSLKEREEAVRYGEERVTQLIDQCATLRRQIFKAECNIERDAAEKKILAEEVKV